jgi:hypothetical protein
MNKKSTSTAYTILNSILKKYDTPFPLVNLDLFIAELRETGQRALSEDPNFPIEFFREESHIAIKWMLKGFEELPASYVGRMLQRLWEFHKHAMTFDHSDDAADKILADAELAVKGVCAEERAMYIAILHEYDRECKKEKREGM